MVVKEKNYIKVTCENGKTYFFDINQGVVLGLGGSPLKNTPVGFNKMLDICATAHPTVQALVQMHRYSGRPYTKMVEYAKTLAIIDRIVSIGASPFTLRGDLYKTFFYEFVNDYFQRFVKFIQENPDNTLEDFYCDYSLVLFKNEYQKYDADEHLNDNFYQELCSRVYHNSNWNERQIQAIVYFSSRGLYEYYEESVSTVLSSCRNYFYFCDTLNRSYYSKSEKDYFRNYVNVRREYYMQKKELDEKSLRENQGRVAEKLFFENDYFTIIIPMTSEEFKAEGNNQKNCVYSLYLSRVVSGLTNVVFIRKKSNPNKSWITCEVKDGNICQFLGKHNSNFDYDSIETAFYREYREHLKKVWGGA